MIYLKAKKPPKSPYMQDMDKKLAVLIQPDLRGRVHNNEELESAIMKSTGPILIATGLFGSNEPIEISKEEFLSTWQGD